MIDTIVIRVLNFSKYKQLYEQYYTPQQTKGSVTVAYADADTGEVLQRVLVKSTVYHDNNRFIPTTYRGSKHVASSHYTLSYSFNTQLDYLEFNFAIPKYLYGTNLLQFISIYDQQASTHFQRLRIFIHKFIKENFIQEPLREDLEINRIDLCYNQFFNSKEDALHYLDEQKKLLVKFARSSKNNYRSYDTSLLYITKRYSFKIYHKGTEFRKNDFRELVKKNTLNYPLNEFLVHADNVLRYEMTFRKSFLNYIMNHYFFSSVTKVESPIYNQHPLAKFGAQLNVSIFDGDRSFRGRYSSAIEAWTAKAKVFTLKSPFDHVDFDSKLSSEDLLLLFDSNTVSFDQTFFTILFNEFWKKVKQYQLDHLLDPNEIKLRIRQSNENTVLKNTLRRKPEFMKSEFRLLSAAMLVQFMKFSELKSMMPKASYFRLKKDLDKIGISDNSAKLDCPKPALDYLDYRLYFSTFHNEV